MIGRTLSAQAETDLEEIGDFIAADNPDRAITFIQAIRDHCDQISRHPNAFRTRPEFGPGSRVALHGRYLIIFTQNSGGILIERIVHGARDLRRLRS